METYAKVPDSHEGQVGCGRVGFPEGTPAIAIVLSCEGNA